jgi:hypothetical protein
MSVRAAIAATAAALMVAACSPVAVPPPPATIIGDPVVGHTLTVEPGRWQNAPTAFAYRWDRCANPGPTSCVRAGTGSSYLLTAGDVGSWLAVSVTATNGAGSGSTRTAAVGPVTDGTPTFDPDDGGPVPPPAVGEPFHVQLGGAPAGSTFEVVAGSGSLPAGVTLSPDGLISGTPTGPGTLWAVDVAVTPPAASSARARSIAPAHLWGYTWSLQSSLPLPATVAGTPDSPVLLLSSNGTSLDHFWRIGTDGVVTEPAVTDFGPQVGLVPDSQGADSLFGSFGLATSGRSIVGQGSCGLDVVDLTHGPQVPLPVLRSISLSGTSGCNAYITPTRLWLVDPPVPGDDDGQIGVLDLTGTNGPVVAPLHWSSDRPLLSPGVVASDGSALYLMSGDSQGLPPYSILRVGPDATTWITETTQLDDPCHTFSQALNRTRGSSPEMVVTCPDPSVPSGPVGATTWIVRTVDLSTGQARSIGSAEGIGVVPNYVGMTTAPSGQALVDGFDLTTHHPFVSAVGGTSGSAAVPILRDLTGNVVAVFDL